MLQENPPDKELSISITKIFNWPSQDSANNDFQLIFYPEQTDWAPIIQKSITGTFASNSMIINAFLKISYTDDETIVIMKMLIRGNLLGQFPIDLEALRDKKVQYFNFGSNQVLQVNIYTPKNNTQLRPQNDIIHSKISTSNSTNNVIQSLPHQLKVDQYQRRGDSDRVSLALRYYDQGGYEDEDFSAEFQGRKQYGYGGYPEQQKIFYSRNQAPMQGMLIGDEERSSRSRLSYLDDEETSVKGPRRSYAPRNAAYYRDRQYGQSGRLKKNFSEKVLSLLNEVKVMKDELSSSRITNGPRSVNNGLHNQNPRNFRKDKKSMSQTNLMQARSNYPAYSTNTRQQQKEIHNTQNKPIKKHRLILNSLNVVPYQEYYQKNRPQSIGIQPRLGDIYPTENQNYYYGSKIR